MQDAVLQNTLVMTWQPIGQLEHGWCTLGGVTLQSAHLANDDITKQGGKKLKQRELKAQSFMMTDYVQWDGN